MACCWLLEVKEKFMLKTLKDFWGGKQEGNSKKRRRHLHWYLHSALLVELLLHACKRNILLLHCDFIRNTQVLKKLLSSFVSNDLTNTIKKKSL